jgi:ParB family chromosome partitioning protein
MNFDPSKPWAGRVPLETVCRNPEQPRKRFDPAELAKLGASLKRRQQVPCPVIPYQTEKRPQVRWMLVDGERRWRAAQAAGLETLWVAYEPGVDAENIHESSLAANFCREGHTKMDTAAALKREIDAGKTRDELAAVVGKSESWVTTHLLLNDLVPALQQLLDPPTPKEQRISLTIAARLAGYPQERQFMLYKKHVAGRALTQAAHSLRVNEGAAKSSVSDVRYALGRIRYARAAVGELQLIRERMVKEMTREEADQALKVLEEIRTHVTQLTVDLRCVK